MSGKSGGTRGHLSLDAPQGEEEGPSLGDVLPQEGDDQEEAAHRLATRQEIEELSRQMGEFGVGLSDVRTTAPSRSAPFPPAGGR